MKEKVEKTQPLPKPSASLISRMSSKKSTRHGKKPQPLRRGLALPGAVGLVPELLQVLFNVDQLLFQVAVEKIGTLDGQA